MRWFFLAELLMLVDGIRRSDIDFPTLMYFLSTLFVVFFSVHGIQNWPASWAQGAIILACTLPAIGVLIKSWPDISSGETWPVEFKFVLIIVILAMLNVCFSEDRPASFKGMGLFLMSGILVFSVSFSLFGTKQTQDRFLGLCSLCFITLLICGIFEFSQQINIPESRILLFSGNPIPAGSLLILLSVGPLVLLAKSNSSLQRFFWILCILSGALLITFIAQRGPALAVIVMVFFIAATKRKGIWVFTLVALALMGTGYLIAEKVPPQLKNKLLKEDTLLVRMELYHVALDVFKEKPIFGLGFNSSISRFIPYDYEAKIYPTDQKESFQSMVAGVQVFDNIALSFLGEAGGLFTLAYIGLVVYLLINILKARRSGLPDKTQVILILVVLAGFLTHSMSFDSFKYPHLSWVFHSLLGLIARCKISDQTLLAGNPQHIKTELNK
jgi:O-antigen ligase